mmetsp:Transcript_28449/g.39303  ORF Transcript_28449/g.39303 Transcript_28449/m.39303 type:complete len:216 (-) Transcript_28449:8-655(-)
MFSKANLEGDFKFKFKSIFGLTSLKSEVSVKMFRKAFSRSQIYIRTKHIFASDSGHVGFRERNKIIGKQPTLKEVRTRGLSQQAPQLAPTLSPTSTSSDAPPSISRPVVIFTAGLPGAGKTSALHQLYSLEDEDILDLDTEMKACPLYDPGAPASVYDVPEAYYWADSKLEAKYINRLQSPPIITAVDGTGSKVDRTVRRMREAQEAGCIVELVM